MEVTPVSPGRPSHTTSWEPML